MRGVRLSSLLIFLWASLLLSGAPAKSAETIVQKRAREANRLLPLKKITVGPDDQYAAAIDPSGSVVVYAHKADLVAHLRVQDLKTGDARDLLPLTADSQEPVFSPEGKLAFAYFRFNARGDVCYIDQLPKSTKAAPKTIDEKDIKCLPRSGEGAGAQRLNPFWMSKNELGFLERDVSLQDSRIVVINIASGERRVLASGRLWSPSMRAGGHLLAYNELVTNGNVSARRLVVKDLAQANAKPRVITLALPGISGFPVFSEDESQLYFSHFMNDTNDDRAIDGSDNAVVFRIPLSRVLAQKDGDETFPEQLTSVETSCSFPRPARDTVFVTCAFEGSLDIYQMPATGVVPAQWDAKLLSNALQTSRSYQDRILLLNTMKFRAGGATSRELEERLMSAHIFSDDTQAARFYLRGLSRGANARDKAFFEMLGLYLEGRELKKAQPTDEVSRELRRQITTLDARIAKVEGEPRFRSAVRGLLRLFIDEQKAADSLLRQTRTAGTVRPLERYFLFELARRVHRRQLPALSEDYRTVISAPEINAESKIYYAFTYLEEVATLEKDRAKRIAQIEKFANGLPAPVQALLKSESAVLRLIAAKDQPAKMAVYRELDKLMSESRTDYFLRKALYVRAILNFADAAEFEFMNYVATNWIRYTELSDTEFFYAKEVFSGTNLDRAYENLSQGKSLLASNYFFESLSLTDDLESHFGYITTRVKMNDRKTIDSRYEVLRNRQFIGDNLKYVEALLTLIDESDKATADPKYVKHLDAAIAKLQSMEQDRDSASRYLLLGYCQMEKVLRQANGADFPNDLFEDANRSLLLAYDLGRDNDRIKASALMDLGLLHSRVQNYGLATRYLGLRKRISFESEEERAAFEYIYAKALAHNYQPDQAAQTLASLPAPVKSAPHLERQAFNSAIADRPKEAIPLYEALLQSGKIEGDANLARVNLTYGYSLFKARREPEARRVLLTALDHASKSKETKAGGEQLVDFKPDRIRLVAYGLLGQIGAAEEKRDALEKRATLLRSSKKEVEDWQPLLIQNRWQLVEIESNDRALDRISEALDLAADYAKENQYTANPVFRTVDNALAFAITRKLTYDGSRAKKLEALYQNSLKAFAAQKIAQPALDFQRLKMEVLYAAYSKRPAEITGLLASAPAQSLKEALPVQSKELEQLAAALK